MDITRLDQENDRSTNSIAVFRLWFASTLASSDRRTMSPISFWRSIFGNGMGISPNLVCEIVSITEAYRP
jgi:hypothetical protein